MEVAMSASASDKATAQLLVDRINTVLETKWFSWVEKNAVWNAIEQLSHDRIEQAAPAYEQAVLFALLLMYREDSGFLGDGEIQEIDNEENASVSQPSSAQSSEQWSEQEWQHDSQAGQDTSSSVSSSANANLTASASSLSSQELSQAMLDAVNQERQREGLEPFVLNEMLFDMAQGYAEYMADTGRFDHTDAEGNTIVDRAEMVWYVYSSLGENIAWNQSSVDEVMKAWMNSPGHRSNILENRFTQLGVGYSNGYRVQVFGTPR